MSSQIKNTIRSMGEHPKTHSWGCGGPSLQEETGRNWENWEKLGELWSLCPAGDLTCLTRDSAGRGTSARPGRQIKGGKEEAVQSKLVKIRVRLINQDQGIFWVGGNPQWSNARVALHGQPQESQQVPLPGINLGQEQQGQQRIQQGNVSWRAPSAKETEEL